MSKANGHTIGTNHHRDVRPPQTGAPAIEFTALVKRYGAMSAVDGLSFTVAYGRVVGFLGPNGAGKTTTLRTLLGLVRPSAGTATIDGTQYSDLAEPTRTVGALLSAYAAHPGRTGRNHLRVLALTAGATPGRVEELLDLVGLQSAAERRVGGYSLGMRQRLGLAAALLGDPKVLVLDEPANGLDPEGIRWLRELLRSLAAHGRAVLISSHVLTEVAQSVDDVVIIRAGRSVLQTPLADLLARHTDRVMVAGPDIGRLAHLLRATGARVATKGPDAIAVDDLSQEEVLHLIASHRLMVDQISSSAPSLEDIYLGLTSNKIGNPA